MSADNPSLEDLLSGSDSSPEKQLQQKIKSIIDEKKEIETQNKARELGLPYINLVGFPVPQNALIVDEETAKKMGVVCFFYEDGQIKLATATPPTDQLQEFINHLQKQYRAEVQLFFTSPKSLQTVLEMYKRLPKKTDTSTKVEISENDLQKWSEAINKLNQLNEQIKQASTSEIVTIIIAAAVKSDASDVHIEVEKEDIKIRLRIDGVLHTVATLPSELWPRIINRIKLLAKLKLNITDKPQDGRFTIFLTNDEIDVRVSTIPTAFGESVVMRLLRSSAVGLSFDDLGLEGRAYMQLKREIEKPNGMIITTGPTGSGKTTTLYAILNKLNTPENKIITLEDPIEYKLEGINQSQVDASKGYTFAKGLRAILRQDPDVVMVGEIRDSETVDIAINAALTGHLVLSTLHTNSAAATIPRFLAMGAKPFLLTPALNAIIGQRLVRKICQQCKEAVELDEEIKQRVLEIINSIPDDAPEKKEINLDNLTFYHGKGCSACQGLGFKGRIGIFEIMTMNEEIEKITLSGKVSEYELQKAAVKNGMLTMVQDGIIKALKGITTVEEVFKKAE